MTASPEQSASRAGWYPWAVAALLATLVVAVFAPGLHHGFVNIDDGIYVVENDPIRQGLSWEGVTWAFTTLHTGNWHPLTWLSLLADVSAWGYGPFGHHVTNLALHVAATLALFGLLRHATGSVARSALVAALFGIHPLHVESVAWISERKDVLSTLLGLLALWAYQLHRARPGAGRYALVVAAFVLSLLAKPMFVTLPVLLLLWDRWPLGRPVPSPAAAGRLLLEKLPLFAISAVSSAVTIYAQSRTSIVALADLPLPDRVAQAIHSTGWYLAKTVWPSGLAAFYPYERASGWAVALAAVAIVAISAGVALRRSGPLVTGWLWYLVTLLPVIGIVQVGAQARADRYTYVPLIGIFILIAWAIPSPAPAPAPRATRAERLRGGAPLALLATALLLMLAVAARAQVAHWRDAETLMRRAVTVTDRNWFAHSALGRILSLDGRLDEAGWHLRLAAQLAPENPDVWFNLGVVHADAQRWDEAVACLQRALRFREGWPEAHYNLGRALQALGALDEAAGEYAAAIALAPGYADAHNNLAAVHLSRGDLHAAGASAAAAARLDPVSPYPHLNLALVHLYRGDHGSAFGALARARALGAVISPEVSREFERFTGSAGPTR